MKNQPWALLLAAGPQGRSKGWVEQNKTKHKVLVFCRG